jgi:hypothetical protein
MTVLAAQPEEAMAEPFAQVSGKPAASQAEGAQHRSSRAGRRGLLWSTASAAWLRPVGVQRGIRVRRRSASSPS